MKVLSITTNYPKNSLDRIGSFIHELNKKIIEQGFDVIVLSPDCPPQKNEPFIEGAHIKRFQYFFPRHSQALAGKYGIIQNIKLNPLILLQIPFFFYFGILAGISIIQHCKPDIIHAHWLIPSGLFGILFKKIFCIPLIITVHGTDVRNLPTIFKKMFLKQADAIISPHPEITQKICECNLFAHHIPNLIEEKPQPLSDLEELLPEIKEKKVISFIGRLDVFKDPITLVQSVPIILKKRNDILIIIAGDGNLKKDILQLIKKFGIQRSVKILGWFDETPLILQKTNIFVSLSPIENIWSLSLVEAMKASIPCIVTNCGTTLSVLRDKKDAILIHSHNPSELAEKILFLLENEEIGKKIGSSGKKIVDDLFNNEKNTQQIMKIYSQISRKKC
ncbi:glycosyltransferase family 4 protein [Methanospirillum stamsii]|uniref:Glycosyltransferase family 4 protein n=1 Tax=Methanospirillum stamsii TaxID=1277351 RepID=A0A2V2N8R2_9EURY|nr:glycosyltransferase family 4 protein [Methanospirillum stamsii]PWR72908.1 hypothetical protein DLD82_11610 [Methanospirillum stamsii]